jgi:hypothetical protein
MDFGDVTALIAGGWDAFRALATAGLVVLAYYVGGAIQNASKTRIRAYLTYFGGLTIFALVAGTGLGTNIEDADPLFGGGTVVEDYPTTTHERTRHAVFVFFTFGIAGALGIAKAKPMVEKELEDSIASSVASVRAVLLADARARYEAAERQRMIHRQLRQVLAKPDLPTFISLLTQVSDIDAKQDELNDPQRALLLDAAEAGATEFGALLLDHGAQINQADTYRGGQTALDLAAQKGHMATVELLLSRGADVNAADQWGNRPLWYAATCHGGHPEVVEVLLQYGADVDARDSGDRTVLDWVSLDEPQGPRLKVIELLERYGAQRQPTKRD